MNSTKVNRDAGSSCSCDRGLHRYLRNFGGVEPPKPPLRYATAHTHTHTPLGKSRSTSSLVMLSSSQYFRDAISYNLTSTFILQFKITLPNTDQAHNKHQWTTANFNQVQLYTPWWWIAYDPKYVGVIFNFVSFKLLYNVDFNLKVLYNRVHLVG